MPKNFIAISGLAKSGKSTVSKILLEELGLKKYSVGDYFKARWREEFPDADISEFTPWWNARPLREQREANRVAKEKILSGEYVADLRYLKDLENQGGVLVFVYSKRQTRAERAIEAGAYPGKSLKEVMDDLRRRDMDEVHWGEKLYGYNFTRAKHYNIFLNSESLTQKQTANIILSAYNS